MEKKVKFFLLSIYTALKYLYVKKDNPIHALAKSLNNVDERKSKNWLLDP